MSEMEDKLNAILGDPQAMGQIMALAKSLGGGSGPSKPPEPPEERGSAPAQEGQGRGEVRDGRGGEKASPALDLSALLGSLAGGEGGVDPRLLTMLSRVMEEYQSDDDSRTALLNALRPYVKEKRYAKLDKAIQIARLSRLIRVGLDVFKGGEHV